MIFLEECLLPKVKESQLVSWNRNSKHSDWSLEMEILIFKMCRWSPSKTTPAPQMQISSPKGNMTLEGLKDYVIWTQRTDSVTSLENAEMVFAGFGIVAPEYGWDDYKNIDVKDKIVVVLVNDPGFGTEEASLFKGNTMTYYGRWTYKYEEAIRQGALGCLIVHNTIPAGYGFNVVQNSWNASKLYLDD
ncbi:peptidase M28 [Daphnia sinensis]|uniref:Peptidase M28 n=1 Tax=Daphnia sinensis TaxID=1820382 RepID=A0AAD5KE20_9CRUS|nr:peptidase M28 [Daphnia sinensis]